MYSGKLLNLFDKNKKNYKNYHKKMIFFFEYIYKINDKYKNDIQKY